MKKLLVVLLLSGCALTHEPKLTSPPEDVAKYEADLQSCYSEADKRWDDAQNRNEFHQSMSQGFGLVGALASQPKYDPTDDYFKSYPELVDDCFAKRGYEVIAD